MTGTPNQDDARIALRIKVAAKLCIMALWSSDRQLQELDPLIDAASAIEKANPADLVAFARALASAVSDDSDPLPELGAALRVLGPKRDTR